MGPITQEGDHLPAFIFFLAPQRVGGLRVAPEVFQSQPYHGLRVRTESISVIVPIKNKARFLETCVGSILAAATRVDGVDVLLVDNMSTDGSAEILRREFSETASITQSTGRNAATVRNHGARRTSGSVVCFLDADCIVPLDYFSQIRAVFSKSWIAAAGCGVDLPTDGSWIERTWHALHFRGVDGFRSYVNSGNLALRRGVFESIGGFDESLETGEDANLGARLVVAGHPVFETRALQVLHIDNPATLRQFYRKEVWHALGMFGTTGFGHLDKPVLATALHLVLTIGAASALLVAIARRSPELLAWGLALLLLVPTMTVAYRRILSSQKPRLFAALVLYEVYFLARAAALIRLLAPRGGRARQ